MGVTKVNVAISDLLNVYQNKISEDAPITSSSFAFKMSIEGLFGWLI